MAWLFLSAVLLAVAFINLGAMSVWVSVLSAALKIIVLVVVIAAVYAAGSMLWRRYRSTSDV